jgi:hypothetical protein
MKNEPDIGNIIKGEAFRDAIHVAVAPVVVGDDRISPGEHVGFLPDGRVGRKSSNLIGVIDPFITSKYLFEDSKCYLFLYPKSISSLRHEWTHPAFEEADTAAANKPDKKASEQWLREYAIKVMDRDYCDDPFDTLITDIRMRSLTYRGRDCHGYHDLIEPELLFHHASVYLGESVTKEQFEYFSCTC